MLFHELHWEFIAYSRPCVEVIQQNLHLTSITADHWGLMISQIMRTSKGYFVTCLFVKVCNFFHIKSAPFSPLKFIICILPCIFLHFNICRIMFWICFSYQVSIWTGFQFDYVFDWTILKYQQSQLATPPTRAIVSVFLISPFGVILLSATDETSWCFI